MPTRGIFPAPPIATDTGHNGMPHIPGAWMVISRWATLLSVSYGVPQSYGHYCIQITCLPHSYINGNQKHKTKK